MLETCAWHKDDEPIDDSLTVGCQECGRLIATKDCPLCHETFIDWSDDTFDDVIAGPGVTASGDFMCVRCARNQNEAEEAAEAEEQDYFPGPWDE